MPVSKKPTEVRMGKGKGAPEFWAVRVAPGRIMFEIDGVPGPIAREALTLAAATSYASKNVRINAIAPGLVRTPLSKRVWDNPKSAESSRAMHALGRLGEPEDIASLVAWLLAPANSWVTGQVIGVDGGLGSLRTRA